MKRLASTSPIVRVAVSCCLISMLFVTAHAYNPGTEGSVTKGHPWITNKTIEYLKQTDPFVYILANQYREQLIFGSWYADRNSGTCDVTPGPSWPCDSTNHYDPKFKQTWGELAFFDGFGAEGSVTASQYAGYLFEVASRCWNSRDLPQDTPARVGKWVSSLPDSCRVFEWRKVSDINLKGGFGQFSSNGALVRISPMQLLGWTLHLLQDVTQVYHTYSVADNGHGGFEDDIDRFIEAGKGNRLPSTTTDTWREVSNEGGPEPFVKQVAKDTAAIGVNAGVVQTIQRNNNLPSILWCCEIPGNKLDSFTEASLNRGIIYSAKLLRFYFQQPAIELASAIWTNAAF